MAGLDTGCNVRDSLQPARTLTIDRAKRNGVRDTRPNLRHATRNGARSVLEDVAYANLEWVRAGKMQQRKDAMIAFTSHGGRLAGAEKTQTKDCQ